LWPNGIAESDVHLQALADRAESSIEHDSDARVFVLRADGLDIEARRVVPDPIVFDVSAANGGDISADGLRVVTAMCEQIEVEGRPIWLIRPQPQEHRSFEHESLAHR
jgi:hypothetical protein